jgi:predicted TIM-barrel fold metal-dependent hydrolase
MPRSASVPPGRSEDGVTAVLRTLPKVDAHHHLWDISLNRHPWLKQPPFEHRTYGDWANLRRSFLIEDFLADSMPHSVVKSVHVQADWDASDPVGETRWCQSIADRHGFPHAIVAFANLADANLQKVLEAHRTYANTRGIRQILGHLDDPELRRLDRPDYLSDPAWETGYALLGKLSLSFDLQVLPPQLEAAARIAAKHEDVRVVVCHTGLPWQRNEDGIRLWRRGMKALAAAPHAYAKLSGPGMVMPCWSAERFAPFIDETIDLFGPERCMFASNFPTDTLHATLDQTYGAFYRWASAYSPSEQKALFYDTAASFYLL